MRLSSPGPAPTLSGHRAHRQCRGRADRVIVDVAGKAAAITGAGHVSAGPIQAVNERRASAAVKPPGVPGRGELEGDCREAEQHPEGAALAPHGVRSPRLGDCADDEQWHCREHDDLQ